MAILQMTFSLSAPARRALGTLQTVKQLEHIAERFFDRLAHERYRDFAVTPQYYTTAHGYRAARRIGQRPPREKCIGVRVTLTIHMLRSMKKLESRGLQLAWQIEEILYFGFLHGYV
ncbi:MAG: hypothetical protein JSR44_15710 [Spirochaetes bacterium]|nr:hypothetical protein [Spirochaetota bacterium]